MVSRVIQSWSVRKDPVSAAATTTCWDSRLSRWRNSLGSCDPDISKWEWDVSWCFHTHNCGTGKGVQLQESLHFLRHQQQQPRGVGKWWFLYFAFQISPKCSRHIICIQNARCGNTGESRWLLSRPSRLKKSGKGIERVSTPHRELPRKKKVTNRIGVQID